MDNTTQAGIFSTPLGQRIYAQFAEALSDFSMESALRSGVLVGLSGGADSVMLLHLLCEYRRRTEGDFSILAVHINHGIRGAEADRDEAFARELSASLGVEFVSHKIDVPTLAREGNKGLEEAARDARYSIFAGEKPQRNV